LTSALSSGDAVAEVVVADDGDSDGPLIDAFKGDRRLHYLRGPRRGLGANRNAALAVARSPHVLFLDDDALVSRSFLERWRAALRSQPEHWRDRLIFTGGELQGALPVYAGDQSFLGFQSRIYRPKEARRTVVMNAAVFPRELFRHVRFDEQLVYGYDEVDLTTRAVAAGYRIVFDPEALNEHRPSPVNRAMYARHVDASRLYVTLKRYWWTERAPAKAVAFAVCAPVHLLAANVKAARIKGLADTGRVLALTARYLRAARP
jgi:GT2 family glycosyltransferase